MAGVFSLFILVPIIIVQVTEIKSLISKSLLLDYIVFGTTGNVTTNDVYYLSPNGTDVSTCGKTPYAACKTLEHVLSLYYNTTHPPEKGLEIITSKSLNIDGSFMEKYPQFTSSNLILSSWDEMEFPSSFPLINVYDVDFSQSYWEIKKLNIHMDNSNTSLLTLYAHATPLKDNITCLMNITINDCTIGYWLLQGISDISITNCRKMNTILARNFPVVTFDNCRASLENISVGNVEFSNDTSSHAIHAQGNSFITVKRSQFYNNKVYAGLLTVLGNSTLEIEDCQFWGNQAEDAAACVAMENSFVKITKTIFKNNFAESGGVMEVLEYTRLIIYNSIFNNNSATSWGSCFYVDDHAKISIYDSNFSSNRVPKGHGGVFRVRNHCFVNIVNSNFSSNFAFQIGGVLDIYYACILVMYQELARNSE